MQSSSQLFPVQLVSAELIGDLIEDIYLLKPNNSADRSVEIAVTRLSLKHNDGIPSQDHGQPIVLLHGAFSNRRHWLSPEGKGVAAFLVEAGYDVWLPEMRGHGLSPKNKHFLGNTLDKVIEYDIPAIHKFVVEQTGKSVAYIAEELGGFFALGAMELGIIDQKTVAGCVYIEEEKPLSLRLNTKIFAKNSLWRSKKHGVISGRRAGGGSENESYSLIKEYLCWQNRLSYNKPSGLLLENAYRSIETPVFVVGTKSADSISPVRRAKWVYGQLEASPKMYKKYDYSRSHQQRIYTDGSKTLFPTESGCWQDILCWLQQRYKDIKCSESELCYQELPSEVAI